MTDGPLVLPPMGDWAEEASCADLGEGADVFTDDQADAEDLAFAEAVCWRCPVLEDCRSYAATAPVYGLWGAVWHSGITTHRAAA